jgi:hypothetical protein
MPEEIVVPLVTVTQDLFTVVPYHRAISSGKNKSSIGRAVGKRPTTGAAEPRG